MREELLGFPDYLLAVPVSNVVALVPLTPGGVGTRDAAMALLLSAMGAAQDKVGTIPIGFTAVLVLWALVGGVTFAFSGSSS